MSNISNIINMYSKFKFQNIKFLYREVMMQSLFHSEDDMTLLYQRDDRRDSLPDTCEGYLFAA